MLEDFVGSDVWSIMDLDSSMSDVDEVDSCDSWRILTRTHMMDVCA